jgi:hypothetical protein
MESGVSTGEKDGTTAKRHLERYFQILQATRPDATLGRGTGSGGSAVQGLSFQDANWVRWIPALVAVRYGESSLVKELRAATVADLYAVLDAVERRTLAKHVWVGK